MNDKSWFRVLLTGFLWLNVFKQFIMYVIIYLLLLLLYGVSYSFSNLILHKDGVYSVQNAFLSPTHSLTFLSILTKSLLSTNWIASTITFASLFVTCGVILDCQLLPFRDPSENFYFSPTLFWNLCWYCSAY